METYDETDISIFAGFYYSVAMLKQQTASRFKLLTPVESIQKTDCFQLAQASK